MPKHGSAQFALVNPVGDAVDELLRWGRFARKRHGDKYSRPLRACMPVTPCSCKPAIPRQAKSPSACDEWYGAARGLHGRGNRHPSGTSPDKAYATAAEQAEAAIEDGLKNNKGTVDLSKKSRMVAEVRISSLEQWTRMLGRISAVPSVHDVDVIALNTGEARLGFSYSGTPDQLRSAAAQSNLTIAERGRLMVDRRERISADAEGTSE